MDQVLYHQDMKMYLYGKQKADIQKRYEAWLQQHDSVQSANKDETIVSVIKRFFGEHITSRLIQMQNRN
jgi:hypothetical protein